MKILDTPTGLAAVAWALAALIGLSALSVTLIGRPGDAVTAAITTTVVMVVAELSPHDAWQQPILRLADTPIGVAVGIAAAWTGLRFIRRPSRTDLDRPDHQTITAVQLNLRRAVQFNLRRAVQFNLRRAVQLFLRRKVRIMTNASQEAPKILDVPIGLDAAGTRREFDSLGDVEVPANRYWGAQTQRSLEHFNIGHDRMPKEVYHAYGYVKKAAAVVNTRAGRLPGWKGQLIQRVCDEVISGALDEEFPLYVWQTGSGTQSNMNVNEVISNRCIQLVGGTLGSQEPVHPNDHVNMGQSSNDTFPTAMHIAAYQMATDKTIPALKRLRDAVEANAKKWAGVVKIGRTHLEDATPLTVGQEWSGYAGALDDAIGEVEHATGGLLALAMGGTAVGTGLNAPAGFGDEVAARIASMTGAPFTSAANKFTAQGTLDRLMRAHGGLKAAAVTLYKIANDLRWLGSGPRTGIHELIFPANEPGSSIMPGKINPTQAEAMLMVAIQIIASDVAVTMGGAEGNFELNAFRPILISNYLHSALIMADMCDHFREFMVEGTKLNEAKLKENIDRSVMMVTALSPVIGYDKAAVISYYAIDHDLTLKQAALANGVSEELFDRVVDPLALTRGGSADIPSGAKEA